MYKIAIIEDDKPTNDTFMGYLNKLWPDCQVDQFFDFESANGSLAKCGYDLVISDIDLGAGSDKYGGAKISKALHSRQIPLLIISGLPQPELHREIFRALDAWDYLQKPVTESDFINQVTRAITFVQAQVRVMGVSSNSQPLPNQDSNLVINLHSRDKVTWKGTRLNLSLTQIRLLETLIASANNPVTFDTLFEQIDSGRNKQNLRVHIAAIRSEFIAADPTFDSLHTVPMLGYLWHV